MMEQVLNLLFSFIDTCQKNSRFILRFLTLIRSLSTFSALGLEPGLQI